MQPQQLKKGQIARSIAGHDKGKFYLVVAWKNNVVWVADGRQKTLLKPKRKNIAHLWYTKVTASCENDTAIRAALDTFLIDAE